MNILYIATDVFFPFMNGGSRRAYETSKIFHEMGHKAVLLVDRNEYEPKFEIIEGIKVYRRDLVDVGAIIRGFSSFIKNKITRIFKSGDKNVPIEEFSKKYESYLKKRNPSSIKSKINDFYRHKFPIHKIIKNFPAFFSIMNIIRKEKIDVIIERGPSYGMGAIAAKLTGRFYIVDFIDIMYSNFALKMADLVLSYFTLYQIPIYIKRSRIKIVKTAVDVRKFKPISKAKKILSKYNISPKDFICVYAGGMYPWHGLDNVVSVAKKLKDKEIYDIHFILVGDGPIRKNLIDIINNKKLNDMISLPGKVSFSEVPIYTGSSNLNMSLNTGDSVGFKLIEYLASGNPVITTNADNVHLILENRVEALFVNINDPEHLMEQILFLKNNPEICKKMGNNARKKIVKDFSWKAHYQNIIDGILQVKDIRI